METLPNLDSADPVYDDKLHFARLLGELLLLAAVWEMQMGASGLLHIAANLTPPWPPKPSPSALPSGSTLQVKCR